MFWLFEGQDSNLRPSGYEPHAASSILIFLEGERASI